MNKLNYLFFSLLLVAGFCFAKKAPSAKESGPFRMGSVLSELSSIAIKTAEISAYMPEEKKFFVVGEEGVVEIIDASNPASLTKVGEVSLQGSASSVSVHGNLVAVSLISEPHWQMGKLQVLRYTDKLEKLKIADVCIQPDMVKFTPDGSKILLACEGEPSEDGKIDPIGAVALVDVKSFIDSPVNASKKESGVTLLEMNASREPEYIAVSADSRIAWVTLQETNEIARIDIPNKKIEAYFDLGFVDHSKPGYALDYVSDGKIQIENANIRSLRQPDGVAVFEENGKSFVITANEGEDLKNFEKKKVCGDDNACRVMFGSRSISAFDGKTGGLLWDSGESLERMFAAVAPGYFNWNSKKGKPREKRSDDKGCEPENVTIGIVGKKRYVFVGLERMSGVAVFDFTDASNPKLVDYYMDPKDRGPEGLLFIPAEKSPIVGVALLVVGYEYSKTLTVYKVE